MLIDFTRIRTEHRRALSDQQLVLLGIAVVLGAPLIGLAIGMAFWGWPQ
jgi:hypothetical protein